MIAAARTQQGAPYRPVDPIDLTSRSRSPDAMGQSLPTRAKQGVALSLMTHAALILGLLLAHSIQPLKESQDSNATYQVVLVPVTTPEPEQTSPTPLPEVLPEQEPTAPAMSAAEPEQASPAPLPEVLPEQEPTAPAPSAAEPVPEHTASQPVAPLHESEPVPPPAVAPAPAPRPRPPVRAAPSKSAKPPHTVASKPPPASPAPIAAARPIKAAPPDAAWLASVSEWLTAHRFYPEAARRRGRQGTVVVRFDVDRLGRVSNANLVHDSGSPVLDQAALALVRDASLPPFPADMPSSEESVTVPIRYQLE